MWQFDRSDQKKPEFTCGAVSLRGTDQTSSNASLYDVERSGRIMRLKRRHSQTCSLGDVIIQSLGIGGAGRDRTDDLKLAKLPLSQLSYGPNPKRMVGPGRLELPTSRLSGVRSNHLSYGPSGSRQRTSLQLANARLKPALMRE